MLSKFTEKLAAWFGENSSYGIEMHSPTLTKLNTYFMEHSLAHLLPYEAYDPTTHLFYNRGSLGFILECRPLCGADPSALDALTTLLNDKLPEYSTLHMLLYANPVIDPLVASWQAHRSQRHDMYTDLAQKRAHYLLQSTKQAPLSSEKTVLRDFRLFIDVTLPADTHVLDAKQCQQDCSNALSQLHIAAKLLNIEGFIAFIYPLLNPTVSKNALPFFKAHDNLAQQVVQPGTSLQISPQGLYFNEGKMAAKTFRITDYPLEWDQWKMGDLIGDPFNHTLRLGCPFLLSLTLHIPSMEKEKTRAHAKNLRAGQQASSPLARFLPHIRRINEDWKRTIAKLADKDRLVKTCFQITLYAPFDTLPQHEAELSALLQHKKWQFSSCPYMQLPAWLMNLPMMVTKEAVEDLKKFNTFKTLHASEIQHIAPLQAEPKGQASPAMMLIGRRGQLLFWDPFENVQGNYNVIIAAKSGSGKSVFTQELITASIGSGGKVWIIDVGRSYQKMTELLGGQFIAFSDNSAISLNPFTHIKDLKTSGHLELLKPLFAQMASPNAPLSDLQKSYLEKAINAAWQTHLQNTTVTHIADFLSAHNDERARDLGNMLFPYTKNGMYGHYFSGPCSLDFTNPLICLELEELKGKKDLQSVVLLLLMYQVTEAMYLGDRATRISCIIDEAWDLLSGVQGSAFVEEGCRRARKYRGNFITCTQSINDYFKNPAAKAAFENSDWQVLLAHKKEALDQLLAEKRIHIDPYSEKILRSLRTLQGQYAEMLIKGPDVNLLGRLILDPFSATLYSTKGSEFAAITQLRAKGMSLTQAIEILMQQPKELTA